ncbi:Globin [Seminavis robusta]|uniref:Globin n=1 Tax=Seminavis robusta TaxID=568900 RepID=A0A9N8DV27_9STRA|nr:Globin [Seminavis robusta]|eukprot:Sro298_g111070.1 Globin (157) ;mRNA; r:27118-27679
MMDGVSYFETVSEVGQSWDKVKRIPTYDEMFGVALFEQMYEIAPDAWGIFPWSAEDMNNKDEKFLQFAKKFVRMLDVAVDMLGPDMDVVEGQLYDLGSFHKRYGVTPKHYDLMGKSLVQTLKKVLGRRSFTDKTDKAWREVYSFMSMTMIQGSAGI